jgi:hypothetical protein
MFTDINSAPHAATPHGIEIVARLIVQQAEEDFRNQCPRTVASSASTDQAC